MAFNINNIRKSSSTTSRNSSVTENDSETKTNGVVATQNWVSRVLDRVWAWTLGFRTGELCVDHFIKTDKVFGRKMSAGRIVAREITLLGKDGKPYNLFVNDRGELEAEFDFERVFVYPGTDLVIKEFQYNPFYPKISENFRGFTPHQIMSKFYPFVDEEYEMVGGKVCSKFCVSDGDGFVVPRTLLVTCDQRKMITGIKICDEQFNLIREIQLPEGKGTRKLTLNMPQIQEDTGWDIVKLPDIIIPPPAPFPPQPPKPGFLPVRPLDPSIFDDIPPNEQDLFARNNDVSFNAPAPTNDIFDTEDVKTDEETTSPTEVEDVRFVDYRTDNYSNVILSKSDFEKNKKQFIMFNVEKV